MAELIVAVVCSVIASSGFWACLLRRHDRKTNITQSQKAQSNMLMGLAHDRILQLGEYYLEKGYVTPDEYSNIKDYLYEPYRALNGNGSAEKIMKYVDSLEIRVEKY